MANFLHSLKFNRLLLCGTLIAFSVESVGSCYGPINVGIINDVAFAFRIEQLVEKVNKAIEKNDGDKLISLMLDVKREVEAYSGISIDLDKQLKKVETEINKKGFGIPKEEFKALTKKLKKKEKRSKHRALYLETCLLNPGMTFNLEEEQLLFNAAHGAEEKEELDVPIRLTVGVTVALVGLFLIVAPVIPPPIKVWGKDLVVYGAAIAAEACYTGYDEHKKK